MLEHVPRPSRMPAVVPRGAVALTHAGGAAAGGAMTPGRGARRHTPLASPTAEGDERCDADQASVDAHSAWSGPVVLSASMIHRGEGPGAEGSVDRDQPLTDADIRSALLAALAADGAFVVPRASVAAPWGVNPAPAPQPEDAPWQSRGAHSVRANMSPDLGVGLAPESTPELVIEELPLRGGYVRADVAVLSPSKLHIYEIKSDRDRLDRLPEQLRLYEEVADRVTVIVGWRHAVKTLRSTPPSCGVWLAERGVRGTVRLVPLRADVQNTRVRARAVAALLPRDDALAFLTARGADAGVRSKPRDVLYDRIGVHVSAPADTAARRLAELRQHVLAYWCRRAKLAAPA